MLAVNVRIALHHRNCLVAGNSLDCGEIDTGLYQTGLYQFGNRRVAHDMGRNRSRVEAVLTMIAREPKARNRAILRVAYCGGLRVSEIVGHSWCDLQERENGEGQATVFGKGGKTRNVLLSATTWAELIALKGDAGPAAPVFVSREGNRLSVDQVWRAARRAGATGNVSPHWLRHASASHALDAGATLATVRDGLGHASVATTSRYLHARPRDGLSRFLKV